MKIKTPKNLIAVGVLAIMVLGAHSVAYAYVPGIWDPQPRIQTGESAFTEVPDTDTTYVDPTTEVAPSPQVTYVYENAPVTQTPPTTQVIYRTLPAGQTTVVNTSSPSNLPPVVSGDQSNTASGFGPDTSNNGLAALSLNGSGGFMPSSVWQWLLVVFLILIVIIIARMFKKPQPHHLAVH